MVFILKNLGVFRMQEIHRNSPAQKIKDFRVLENGTSILIALKGEVSIFNMKKIDYLFKTKKISRIIETEKERYLNFFSNSYKENLEHCQDVIEKYPRWSIISGYYAMHDIAKLFLADKFSIKIDFNVHQTTIGVLKELIKDKQIIGMLNLGYNELILLLNDLAAARKQRTKAQYYTGTEFMHEKYRKEAKIFLNKTVIPFIEKIRELKESK